VPPTEVIQNGLIVGRQERLVGAFTAPDPRKLADPAYELVGTSRRVSRPSGPLALEPNGEDVPATAEERPKKRHLLHGGGRDGRRRKR
jgi:hypothetical protein